MGNDHLLLFYISQKHQELLNLDIILGGLICAPLVLPGISEFLMFFVAIVVEILVIIIR